MSKQKLTRNKVIGLLTLLVLVIVLPIAYLFRNKKPATIVNSKLWRSSKYKKLKPYILAQARHESNNFKSDLFQRANNAFGMKKPLRRKTTALEIPDNGYAVYKNQEDSLQDFFLYLNDFNFPTEVDSLEQYVFKLKNQRYFEDSLNNYAKGVRFWYESYRND